MKKIYLIALLFAVLTGVAVYRFGAALQKSSRQEMTAAVVAVENISQGTLITADMVREEQLPAQAVHRLALKKAEEAQGKIANAPIEANEQILTSRLNEVGKEDGGLSFAIPDGKRAMTVEVDDISGVAGQIKKGNRVDVVASLMMDQINAEGKTEKIAKTVLLLQDIAVLEIGSKYAKEKNEGYKSVTLAITPEESVRLFYAQVNGKLTVALRPVLDTETKSMDPYFPQP